MSLGAVWKMNGLVKESSSAWICDWYTRCTHACMHVPRITLHTPDSQGSQLEIPQQNDISPHRPSPNESRHEQMDSFVVFNSDYEAGPASCQKATEIDKNACLSRAQFPATSSRSRRHSLRHCYPFGAHKPISGEFSAINFCYRQNNAQ